METHVQVQSQGIARSRVSWNKGKLLGQNAPLKLKVIYAIRFRLQMEKRVRELALINLAIDSKLRGCDLKCETKRSVALKNNGLGMSGVGHLNTLEAYTQNAYTADMVFVELTPFVDFRNEYWTDDDLRALQNFLLLSPESGDLIRGGSGLRKIRWAAQGRGKRGGARVIYYWHVPKAHIYLIYGYVKSEREDLTQQQIAALAELMKELKDG